ncbi:MAG: hypothetical protein AB7P04_06645 [Bacteriovoracia bacterium]
MTYLIIRALNAPILILLVSIGAAIQTSLFANWPFLYLQPDVILLATIWCALKRSFTEGGVLVLILGNVAEVHSGAPRGVFLATYMAVYLMIRGMGKLVLIDQLSSFVGLTLFTSIFWKLSVLFVLSTLGIGENIWRHTLALMLPWAVMEGVVGTWVFKWFEKFDWVTFKDPRARASAEEALQLDEEGL